jgi:hypothetical protein
MGGCQGEARRFIALIMNDTEKKARLAAALRENLRKRKAQAREVAAEDRETPAEAPERR